MKTTEFIEQAQKIQGINKALEKEKFNNVAVYTNNRLVVAKVHSSERFNFDLFPAVFKRLTEEAQTDLYALLSEYASTPIAEREDVTLQLEKLNKELSVFLPDGYAVSTYGTKEHKGVLCLHRIEEPIEGATDEAMYIYVDNHILSFPSNEHIPSISIDSLLSIVSYVKKHLEELHALWELDRKQQ